MVLVLSKAKLFVPSVVQDEAEDLSEVKTNCNLITSLGAEILAIGEKRRIKAIFVLCEYDPATYF